MMVLVIEKIFSRASTSISFQPCHYCHRMVRSLLLVSVICIAFVVSTASAFVPPLAFDAPSTTSPVLRSPLLSRGQDDQSVLLLFASTKQDDDSGDNGASSSGGGGGGAINIPRNQLFPLPGDEQVTVARAKSMVELSELLREAGQSGRYVSVKRSVPAVPVSSAAKNTTSLPKGSVVIVLDKDEFSEFQGIKLVEETVPPSTPEPESDVRGVPKKKKKYIQVKRPALIEDLVDEQCQNESIRYSFLPLAAGSDKTILSELFRNNHPRDAYHYFQRSATPIADHVTSFSYLPMSPSTTVEEGVPPKRTWIKDEDREPLSFDDKVVLDATLQVDPEEEIMEVRRLMFLYDETVLEDYILKAFSKNYAASLRDGKLSGVDVTVELFNKPMYFTAQLFVMITASSTTRQQDDAVDALFPDLQLVPTQSELLVDPIDISQMGSGVPDGAKAFNLPSQEYGATLSLEDFGKFSEWLGEAARAAEADANQNLLAHFRLLPEDNVVYADVTVFEEDPKGKRGLDSEELDSLPKFPDSMPTKLSKLDVPSVAITTTRESVETGGLAPPPELKKDDMIVRPGDTILYDRLRAQYASFMESYPDSDFQPYLIASPRTATEIANVVDYASKIDKRVVVRSGGHQYCGFSSGDSRYIQVLMDQMKDDDNSTNMKDGIGLTTEKAQDVRNRGCSIVSPDGTGDDAMQWFVTVAARCRLEDISERLYEEKLTIPHGECPKVGIGGHIQTGGYGHQMRGLGLCLDHVYSFDIVIRPDKNLPARLVTVYRPELVLSDEEAPGRDERLNDDLYKGVLGGSPGAFGVVIRIKFLAIHDKDPAVCESHNMQGKYPHLGGNLQKGATQVVRTMLKYTPTSKLQEGLDVFISIASAEVGSFEVGFIVPELAYTGPQYSEATKNQIKEFQDASRSSAVWGLRRLPFLGHPLRARSPSVVAHQGVRSAGQGVTEEGREFDLPYKKRVNILLDKLPENKAEEFAQ